LRPTKYIVIKSLEGEIDGLYLFKKHKMEDKLEALKKLISEKNKLHQEDTRHTDYSNKLFQLLVSDENDCIQLIHSIDKFDELLDISPLFGHLSAQFESKEFVSGLLPLLEKFKNEEHIDLLEMDIERTKKAF
jgi:hypothetical protein